MQSSTNLRLAKERKEKFFEMIKAYKKRKEEYDKKFQEQMKEDPRRDPAEVEAKLQKQMPTRKQMFAISDF